MKNVTMKLNLPDLESNFSGADVVVPEKVLQGKSYAIFVGPHSFRPYIHTYVLMSVFLVILYYYSNHHAFYA